MKNKRISITNSIKFFRLVKSITKTEDCVKYNVCDAVSDKTLNGVMDILRIAICSKIEDKLEKQYEEY
jgi:hypothetical protein